MVKVKEIKRKKSVRRSKITVKSLISGVRRKLNKEKVEAVITLLEGKYRDLDQAKAVVKKMNKQIKDIEEMDIDEIDTDDYEYDDE